MSYGSKQKVNGNGSNELETNPQGDVSIIFKKTSCILHVIASCINHETGKIHPDDIPISCLKCNAVLCPKQFTIGNEALNLIGYCSECNLKIVIYEPHMSQYIP